MQPIFENKTCLTEDLYLNGIKEYYKIGHKMSRVLTAAYAIVLLGCAAMFLYDLNFILGIPFLVIGVLLIFWQIKGYLITSKKSFHQFALMHQSHYEVDMDFRFYEGHMEQETEKTELAVEYKRISHLYNFPDVLLVVYDKKVIMMDKGSFIKGSTDEILGLMEQNKVKIHNCL
ncbi:MAG: hypothetical protein K2I03_02815 [Lachnospiraceae bacterium]|nr:hypothetical protein [Lachnospiraceae bacterium]